MNLLEFVEFLQWVDKNTYLLDNVRYSTKTDNVRTSFDLAQDFITYKNNQQ